MCTEAKLGTYQSASGFHVRALEVRMRRMLWVVVTGVALAVVLGACGDGGDESDDSFSGTTVTSSDGVLTVQVPEGAAADGVEVTISLIEESDLPSELRGDEVDGMAIIAYELGPDGTEFSEPVVVTFRVNPEELGLDLPDGAVPPGVALTETSDGELEGIEGAVSSRDDEALVIRFELTHFSPAIVALSEETVWMLVPTRVELTVGELGELRVVERDLDTGNDSVPGNDIDSRGRPWLATPPFAISVRGSAEQLLAWPSCSDPTDGWVTDAFSVFLGSRTALAAYFFETGHIGTRLAADGKCNAGPETATPEASSTSVGGAATAVGSASVTPTPRPGQDGVLVSGGSGTTEVGTDNCFNDDGWLAEGECPLNVDIVRVDWTSDGDFLEVVVGFGESVIGDENVSVNVGIRGSEGAPLGTVVDVSSGAATCRYPGSDGALVGESCGVTEDGEIVVRRDTSGLDGDRRLTIGATLFLDDGWLKDAAQVQGISPR